jgi:hypothetical protein
MRQAVLYLRVSTVDQTTANQERELREIASRMSCEIARMPGRLGVARASRIRFSSAAAIGGPMWQNWRLPPLRMDTAG